MQWQLGTQEQSQHGEKPTKRMSSEAEARLNNI
jgi:hypothetical protein